LQLQEFILHKHIVEFFHPGGKLIGFPRTESFSETLINLVN
jgi:hypothetical protein